MEKRAVCPFFGIDDDACDVGCEYISPHDVKIITRFCSSRFQDCLKYQELSERRTPPQSSRPHKEVTMAYAEASLHRSSPTNVPFSALGFLGFALTAVVFSLGAFGPVSLAPFILGVFVILGGFWQIGVGLFDLKQNRLFSAVTFISFGLFWISLAALVIFPRAGFGATPEPLSAVSYVGLWALFTLGLAQGCPKRHIQLFFGLTFLFLAIVAGALGSGAPALQWLAAASGVSCGFFACALALLQSGVRPGTSLAPDKA